ncbi:MAG: Mur ligase family protein [Thermoleophilia bacterium]
MTDAAAWLGARERFGIRLGLERMEALCAALGSPERSLRAVHVVGTNGKSTTTRTVEALLADEGLRVGAYTSPHVTGWAERVRVDGAEADLDAAIERIVPAVEATEAALGDRVTQFEALTAAALVAFADAGLDAVSVEAGLGGRYDATAVLGAPVVVLTNVGLEHRDLLGDTREAIAAEKLAVLRPGATAVLGEPEWEDLARANGAARVLVEPGGALALARAAAGALLGRPVRSDRSEPVRPPGRLERIADDPLELWDGAHNPDGVAWLVRHLEPGPRVVLASILADKDVEAMLDRLAPVAPVLVATTSSSPRALPASDLADRARALGAFEAVEAVDGPLVARERARALARDRGWPLLVAGSLYLLLDLATVRVPCAR